MIRKGISQSVTGLPTEVRFCSRCVISNQRPISGVESSHGLADQKETTRFVNGVCDACRWAEQKEKIDWEDRESQLAELCDRHRKSDGNFDVIVPASGGKDSRYVAHLLKDKYGMNPLTVTWKPHLHTDVGIKNFFSFIDSGFNNILMSPDGSVQRRLSKLAFENLGHPMQPFVVGQRVVGPKAALMYGVSLVFYGDNVAEYGNRIEDNYNPQMPSELFTCFNFEWEDTQLAQYMLSGLTLRELLDNYGFSRNDLMPYRSPSQADIDDHGIEVHYMSYYRKWVPQDNYYYAVQHTGFQPNPTRRDGSFGRYSGVDDMLEDLNYFMHVIKFGMGRATWDAAQEVRSGRLERAEAVTLVQKYDQEYPKTYLTSILEYLGLTQEQFDDILDRFRTPHLWDFDNRGWRLRHVVK